MSELPPAPSSNGASGNGASGPEPMRLGGMAMRNGLLVHGPTSWAAAARNATTGEIDVASGPKPDFGGNGWPRSRCCAGRSGWPRHSR